MSQSTVNSDATNQTDAPVEEVDILVVGGGKAGKSLACLLYTSPSPRDLSTSRMPSSA